MEDFIKKIEALGFVKEVFFYKTDNDENDKDIWVKDNIVIYFDWTIKLWYYSAYSELNYVEGLPYDNIVTDSFFTGLVSK
jgi:hypothetical protein